MDFADEIGERDFGGRDEPIILFKNWLNSYQFSSINPWVIKKRFSAAALMSSHKLLLSWPFERELNLPGISNLRVKFILRDYFLDLCQKLVLTKFRQLSGAKHRVVAHQQRRVDLLIPMLASMNIEHHLPERALHSRQRALQHNEPRA